MNSERRPLLGFVSTTRFDALVTCWPRSSTKHSRDMGAQNFFAHDSLDGRKFSDRILEEGWMGFPIGENIAAGFQNVRSTVLGWVWWVSRGTTNIDLAHGAASRHCRLCSAPLPHVRSLPTGARPEPPPLAIRVCLNLCLMASRRRRHEGQSVRAKA